MLCRGEGATCTPICLAIAIVLGGRSFGLLAVGVTSGICATTRGLAPSPLSRQLLCVNCEARAEGRWGNSSGTATTWPADFGAVLSSLADWCIAERKTPGGAKRPKISNSGVASWVQTSCDAFERGAPGAAARGPWTFLPKSSRMRGRITTTAHAAGKRGVVALTDS